METLDCQTIMRRTTTSLYEDAPLSSAIDFMTENRMGLVPVVDRDEKFVGELSGDILMRAMLPKTLTIVRGMKHAAYLRETRGDMVERLEAVREHTIGEVMDRHANVVHPDTPLIEALILMSQKHNVVPVVEKDSLKLVGAISFFTVLRALTEDAQ